MSEKYKEHVVKTLIEEIAKTQLEIVPGELSTDEKRIIFFKNYSKNDDWSLTRKEAKEVIECLNEKGYKLKLKKIRLTPFGRKDYEFTIPIIIQ